MRLYNYPIVSVFPVCQIINCGASRHKERYKRMDDCVDTLKTFTMIQKILIKGPVIAVCVIGTCYCRSPNVSGVSGSVLNPSGRQVRAIQQKHSH